MAITLKLVKKAADITAQKHDEYGQLELNKVAFRRTGRVEAQSHIKTGVGPLENGMILVIDPVNHEIKKPVGAAEAGLVALHYSAEVMYDERTRGLKHFKVEENEFLPRLGYLEKGDVFTTNSVIYSATATDRDAAIVELKNLISTKKTAGAPVYGYLDSTGYISVTATANSNAKFALQVIEFTTMPDGSDAIKFIVL